MADPGEPLLLVDDLHVSFTTARGELRAVDGVSFSVEERTTVGIVGESGSGKSVMARSLMGLAARRGARVRGSVRIAGTEIVGLRGRGLRRVLGNDVAMVFQDPMTSLNPVRSIGAQLTEAMTEKLGLARAAARTRAVGLLDEVGIPSARRRLRAYPHELSGGMRQRVVIAMALACEPRLLIADEPTTALDVTVQAQILDLLEQEQRERAMAMILITHDFDLAATRSDRIMVMYAGQIVERARSTDLMERPMMPYTSGLIRSIPRLDRPPHEELDVVPGHPPDLADLPAGCRFSPRCWKAVGRCRTEPPALVEEEPPGHAYRCWLPDEAGAAR